MRPCDTSGEGEAQPDAPRSRIARRIPSLKGGKHALQVALSYSEPAVFHKKKRIVTFAANAAARAATIFDGVYR